MNFCKVLKDFYFEFMRVREELKTKEIYLD